MAYLAAYDYDIFISYARVDDEEDMPGGLRWVSTFEKYLSRALKKRLANGDNLSIFFDRRTVNSNDVLTELESAARRSALFIAVCSRNYAEREWTKRELMAFSDSASDSRRLFAIEILPLDDNQTYPEPLRDRAIGSFVAPTSEVGSVMMPLPPQHPDFGLRIHDLAEQIRRQLVAMQMVTEVREAATRPSAAPATEPSGKTVYLGQVTDDLEGERDKVQRHLEQFGHEVRPKTYLRQDGAGFSEDVAQALKGADLHVQLLGPSRGRMPPDLPKGYLRSQIDLAEDAGVASLLWRSDALSLEQVIDPDHRDLLTSKDVVASGAQAFMSLLQDRLATPKAKPAEAPGDDALPMIFIHADGPDLDYARTVRDEFTRQGFLAAIPLEGGDQGDLQAHLRENLVDCDGLVMLYGNTTPVWASRNLRHFNKLRASRQGPPKLVAVVLGPPGEKAEDLGISMPGLQVMGSFDEWQPETISELIRSFQGNR